MNKIINLLKKFALILFIGFGVASLYFIIPASCTRNDETIRVLKQQGYTNIKITGWRPFTKSKDEVFSTGFEATSPNGAIVTGAVTSGFFKGNTIRLD